MEKAVVWLLGLGLGVVGWGVHADWGGWPPPASRPDFNFLQPIGGGQPVGTGEYFFRGQRFVMLDGVAGIEDLGRGPFRHGLGPATRLVLRAEQSAATAALTLHFYNGVPGQNLVMRYDGQPLETLADLPLGPVERTFRLPLGPGEHEFRMEYERWNHHNIELANDGRTMAATFSRLELTFQ